MTKPKSKVVLQLTLLISMLFSSCSKSQTTDPTPIITNTFAKGADVGWLSQMEATGYRFYEQDKCQEGEWKRSAFNGKCQVIIQSGGNKGAIKLEAKSPGLQSATTTFKLQ